MYAKFPVHNIIRLDMNIWKEHYLRQLSHNQQLEAQLKQLDRKLAELRNQLQEEAHRRDRNTDQGYEGMSDVTMRQLLRKLEKEKAEIEWQLKECEWRLNQEAAVSETLEGLHLDEVLFPKILRRVAFVLISV